MRTTEIAPGDPLAGEALGAPGTPRAADTGQPNRLPDVESIEFPRSEPNGALDRSKVLVIVLSGQLLVANREALRVLVLDELDAGRRRIVLDFGSCGYIDASGLGVLLSVTRRTAAMGGRLALAALNDDLVTLCEITKMDTVLVIRPRVIDALAYLARVA